MKALPGPRPMLNGESGSRLRNRALRSLFGVHVSRKFGHDRNPWFQEALSAGSVRHGSLTM